MRRFSVPSGCPFCSPLTRGYNPTYPMVWRKPLLCQCRQNSSVRRQDTHYLPWSTGLYSSPRRQHDFGKFPTSNTARIPPPRQDPIPFTTGPLRVAEAKDLLTWNRLPCPKTTKISDEADVLQPMNRLVSVCTGPQRVLSSPPPASGSAAFLSPSTDRSNGDNSTGAPGSPDIPGPLQKKLGKRKAPKLEFLLPPSGLLPRPALQQLLWDQGDLPPPPKIPRIDTKKASVTTKNAKGQAIQTSDEVDVLQPMNLMVSVCTGPQRALSSPPPASGSAAFLSPSTDRSNGDNSTGAPGSPDIPGPVQKKLGKRKAPKLEFLLPPSGLLPGPALQQLLWDQGDLPPPPKIPRIDTKKASVTTKNRKGQAIQTSDEVDVLQPMNQMVSVCTGPQRVLSSPPPASGSAAFLSPSTDRSNGKNSTGAPGSPDIPGPVQKNLGKRKAPKLEFLLPPSGLLPFPALQQLLWDQDDLPPPPKIPRIDTKKTPVTTKNAKGQAIQTSDEVDVLQPMNLMVSVCTGPQRALSSPPPASGSAAFLSPSTDRSNGKNSTGAPGSPDIPGPVQKNLGKRKAPKLEFLLPPSGLLPFPALQQLLWDQDDLPPPPKIPRIDPLRNPPTDFSTTASCACEDRSWESSLEPAVMDMDTTPASEAAVVSSPTVSSDNTLPFAPGHGCMQQMLPANATVSTGTLVHWVPCYTHNGNNLYTPGPTHVWEQGVSPSGDLAAWIQPGLVPAPPPTVAMNPPHPGEDFEFMDTTPPSKAAILPSSTAVDHVSNSWPPQTVWGPTIAYNHTGATPQSTHALLNGPQSDGCVSRKNPSTSIAAIDLTSLAGQPASGSTAQQGFAGSKPPANCGTPNGTGWASVSYAAMPISRMGSGDCGSSFTNVVPTTSGLVQPVVPPNGKNCQRGKPMQGHMSKPRYYIAGQKEKDSKDAVPSIILKLCRSATHSGDAVQLGAGGH